LITGLTPVIFSCTRSTSCNAYWLNELLGLEGWLDSYTGIPSQLTARIVTATRISLLFLLQFLFSFLTTIRINNIMVLELKFLIERNINMRLMSDNEIRNSLSNVRATLAV